MTRRELRAQIPPETGLRAWVTRRTLAVLRRFSEALDVLEGRMYPVFDNEGLIR